MESSNFPPGGLDHHLVQVVTHPVRAGLLRLLSEQEALWPREAVRHLGLEEQPTLSQVNYHVGVLQRFELVESAGEPDGVRGFSYRPTVKGHLVMVAIGLSTEGAD